MYLKDINGDALAPYLPIEHAGSHLRWLLLWLVTTIVGIALTRHDIENNPDAGLLNVTGLFMAIPGAIGTVAMFLILTSPIGGLTNWWRAFWNRNVVGYTLWMLDGEKTSYYVRSFRHPPPPHDGVMIGVPLHASGVNCLVRGVEPQFLTFVSRRVNIDTGHSRAGIYLDVRDSGTEHVEMGAHDVLDLLRRDARGGPDSIHASSVSELVMKLLNRVRTTTAELEKERVRRNTAACDLVRASNQIHDSVRFVRSKEGAAIRQWIDERIEVHNNDRPIPGYNQFGLM